MKSVNLSVLLIVLAGMIATAARPARASIITLYSSGSSFSGLTFDNATHTVSGGVLHLDGALSSPASDADSARAWVTPTLDNDMNDVIVSADITSSAGNGDFSLGVALGNESGNTPYYEVVFFPGYSAAFLGYYRISVDGALGSNMDLGYTPSNNDPQQVQLDIAPSGLVDITITDSANPSNVLHTSFTAADPSQVYGAGVALYRSWYGRGEGGGEFSDFLITQQSAPEPASLSMLLVGGAMILRRRRA